MPATTSGPIDTWPAWVGARPHSSRRTIRRVPHLCDSRSVPTATLWQCGCKAPDLSRVSGPITTRWVQVGARRRQSIPIKREMPHWERSWWMPAATRWRHGLSETARVMTSASADLIDRRGQLHTFHHATDHHTRHRWSVGMGTCMSSRSCGDPFPVAAGPRSLYARADRNGGIARSTLPPRHHNACFRSEGSRRPRFFAR